MNIENKFELITFELKNKIGHITINREKKYNALNTQVLEELGTLLNELRLDETYDLSGLILQGAGEKAFIAGADISEMSDMTPEQAKSFGELGQGVSFLLEEMNIPVIACVSGFALGGGCELALSCDFILASKTAVFGQPEVKLGLIPGYGGTQRLSKVIGRNRAKEIIYTGRNVDAEEAYRIGLVLKILDDKKAVIEEAEKILLECQKNSPLAITTAKKVMNKGNDYGNREGLKLELEQFTKIFNSEDTKEGTLAFVEKRQAKFTGK